ncbi:exosporium leader peptide-containing protein [Bacillus wiedmannii]|uniref:exosporium leader peptide-containing protein n=1 Tax=Bacillus wiedmannii TaxID=1890302 RepID=UPI003CF061DE
MANKSEHDSKWLDSYKLLFAAALDSSVIGPTFPPISPFTLPTGPTGDTGPTGSTGPTSPPITADSARIINSASQNIADGAAVPLATNAEINGTAITHIAGSTDISLSPNQTYWIFFESESGVGTGTAELEFQLNGTLVGGTQSRATNQAGGSTVSLSSGAVLSTGAAPNILTLVNILGGVRTLTGTNINIVRIQ